VSQPWKSELQVRLTRDACAVQLRAPWSRRVLAEASADGTAAEALPAALKALRRLGHDPLPAQARLLVPEELVYLSLRPACHAWRIAHRDAVDHFAQALGRQDLIVQVAAMPGGAAWLAAAIEPADLSAWQRLFGEQGLALVHVELALLDDLHHVADQVGAHATVALMRDEGMTLVRVADAVPVELSWERCDLQAQRTIEQRLLAYQGTILSSEPAPLLMLCRTAKQRVQWQRLARGHHWTLLLRGEAPQVAAMELPA
jgi:hypothetical protein